MLERRRAPLAWPGSALLADVVDQRSSAQPAAPPISGSRTGPRWWWWDATRTARSLTCDLVLVNPPFHSGVPVDLQPARAIFGALDVVLLPGGRALIVANRTLPWERDLGEIGSVRQLADSRLQDPHTPEIATAPGGRRAVRRSTSADGGSVLQGLRVQGERQPQNREQFSRISGVGESKLEKYADDFLAVILSHIEQTNTEKTDTSAESLRLFKSGLDIEAIARERNIKPSTVYNHLAACIEQGEIKLEAVVDITDQELAAIHEAMLATQNDQAKLKPVYDALDGMFDYEVLRCVRAAMTAG